VDYSIGAVDRDRDSSVSLLRFIINTVFAIIIIIIIIIITIFVIIITIRISISINIFSILVCNFFFFSSPTAAQPVRLNQFNVHLH
jgi:hypothetical protein